MTCMNFRFYDINAVNRVKRRCAIGRVKFQETGCRKEWQRWNGFMWVPADPPARRGARTAPKTGQAVSSGGAG